MVSICTLQLVHRTTTHPTYSAANGSALLSCYPDWPQALLRHKNTHLGVHLRGPLGPRYLIHIQEAPNLVLLKGQAAD